MQSTRSTWSAYYWWNTLKNSETVFAKKLVTVIKTLRVADIPAPKLIFSPLLRVYLFCVNSVANFTRIFFWTPMFKSRCHAVGRRLFLYGGMPYLAGPLSIRMGDDCRISGKITVTGRSAGHCQPQFILGDNVGIGWQVTIAVGTRVEMGNNVRVAGRCFLAGYPGHPVDAVARAQHRPDEEHQAKDIVLEDNVWLGTGCTVLAGVTIGQGTIVGAGSVVTKSLPAGVIAAGNPARVIKRIED